MDLVDPVHVVAAAGAALGVAAVGVAASSARRGEVRLPAVLPLAACCCVVAAGGAAWGITRSALEGDLDAQVQLRMASLCEQSRAVVEGAAAPGVQLAEAYRSVLERSRTCHAAFPTPLPWLAAAWEGCRGCAHVVGLRYANVRGYSYGTDRVEGQQTVSWHGFPKTPPQDSVVRCRGEDDAGAICSWDRCGRDAARCKGTCPSHEQCVGGSVGPRRVSWRGTWDGSAFDPPHVMNVSTYHVKRERWYFFSAEPVVRLADGPAVLTYSTSSPQRDCVVAVDVSFGAPFLRRLSAVLAHAPGAAVHLAALDGRLLASTAPRDGGAAVETLKAAFGNLEDARAATNTIATPRGTVLYVGDCPLIGRDFAVIAVEMPVRGYGRTGSAVAVLTVLGAGLLCAGLAWLLAKWMFRPVAGLRAAVHSFGDGPAQGRRDSVFAEIKELQALIDDTEATLLQARPYLPHHLLVEAQEGGDATSYAADCSTQSLATACGSVPESPTSGEHGAVVAGVLFHATARRHEALPRTARVVCREVVRRRVADLGGFAVRDTPEGFLATFVAAEDAIVFALLVQQDLHAARWPDAVLEAPATAPTADGAWRGVRMKLGVAYGPQSTRPADERRGSSSFDVEGATAALASEAMEACVPGAVAVTLPALDAVGEARDVIGEPVIIPLPSTRVAPELRLLLPHTLRERERDVRMAAEADDDAGSAMLLGCKAYEMFDPNPPLRRRSSLLSFAEWCASSGRRGSVASAASPRSSFSSHSSSATVQAQGAVWGERLRRCPATVGKTVMRPHDARGGNTVDPYCARREADTLACINAALALVLDAVRRTGGTVVSLTGMSVFHMWVQTPLREHVQRALRYVPLLQADLATMRVTVAAGLASGAVLVGNVGGRCQRFPTAVGPATALAGTLAQICLQLGAKALYAQLRPSAAVLLFPDLCTALRPVDVLEVRCGDNDNDNDSDGDNEDGDDDRCAPYASVTVYEVSPRVDPAEANPLAEPVPEAPGARFGWSAEYWEAFARGDAEAMALGYHDPVLRRVRAWLLNGTRRSRVVIDERHFL